MIRNKNYIYFVKLYREKLILVNDLLRCKEYFNIFEVENVLIFLFIRVFRGNVFWFFMGKGFFLFVKYLDDWFGF